MRTPRTVARDNCLAFIRSLCSHTVSEKNAATFSTVARGDHVQDFIQRALRRPGLYSRVIMPLRKENVIYLTPVTSNCRASSSLSGLPLDGVWTHRDLADAA
jgi:hypothetical protein